MKRYYFVAGTCKIPANEDVHQICRVIHYSSVFDDPCGALLAADRILRNEGKRDIVIKAFNRV